LAAANYRGGRLWGGLKVGCRLVLLALQLPGKNGIRRAVRKPLLFGLAVVDNISLALAAHGE
jgi:hypothetical protein